MIKSVRLCICAVTLTLYTIEGLSWSALLQTSPLGKSVVHWTKALQNEHATTKLGARFHFRKLFLRNVDFSHDELGFLLQYLTNETTLPNQAWWAALSEDERYVLNWLPPLLCLALV